MKKRILFQSAPCVALTLFSLNAFAVCSGACTGGQSFTPTSVKMPIWGINLASSTSGAAANLYTCSGSSDSDCYVDIASASALSALAAKASGASIPVGTYDEINMSFCQNAYGSADYTYLMEGSVSLGSTYYTTSSANGYLTTTAASEDYISISTPGCSQQYKFVTPITISTGSTAALSLFTTVVNMAWATNTTSGYGTTSGKVDGYNSSGCVNSGSNYVCANSALVVPYFGTGTPTTQYYQFTDTTNGGVGAQVMALLDSSGNLIGAFPGRVFTSTTASAINFGQSGGFDGQIQLITKNSDGSYVLSNGSQSNTSNGFYLGNFQLLSAVNDTASGSGSALNGSVSYTETRTK